MATTAGFGGRRGGAAEEMVRMVRKGLEMFELLLLVESFLFGIARDMGKLVALYKMMPRSHKVLPSRPNYPFRLGGRY